MKRTLIFQTTIPHYRTRLFDKLRDKHDLQIYLYGSKEPNLKSFDHPHRRLPYIQWRSWTIFVPPVELLKADVVVLQGNIRHLTNIILLVLLPVFGIKTILWGHGISAENYINEIHRPKKWRILFFALANEIWLYTNDVFESLPRRLQRKSHTLYNSVDVNPIPTDRANSISPLKILVCTRWNTKLKLGHLYPAVVRSCRQGQFSFIGDGEYKPALEDDANRVRIYGALFGLEKDQLFAESSVFLHLGWTGLSVLEAMGHGLPVITLRRSPDVKHSVEYDYLIDGYNAKIMDSIGEISAWIDNTDKDELSKLHKGALQTYDKYSFDKFVANFSRRL